MEREKKVTVTARIPKSIGLGLKKIADTNKRSKSAMIEWLIEQAIKQENSTN